MFMSKWNKCITWEDWEGTQDTLCLQLVWRTNVVCVYVYVKHNKSSVKSLGQDKSYRVYLEINKIASNRHFRIQGPLVMLVAVWLDSGHPSTEPKKSRPGRDSSPGHLVQRGVCYLLNNGDYSKAKTSMLTVPSANLKNRQEFSFKAITWKLSDFASLWYLVISGQENWLSKGSVLTTF